MSVLSSVFIFPEIFYLYYSVSSACLKNHFRNLPAPQLTKSLFQTRSRKVWNNAFTVG